MQQRDSRRASNVAVAGFSPNHKNASFCLLRAFLPNRSTAGKHYREFLFTVLRCNPAEKVTAQRSICVSALRKVLTRVKDKLMPNVESVGRVSKKDHSQHTNPHNFSPSWPVSRATRSLSAHDNAQLRNDPAVTGKLRCKASTPASQPRFQTPSDCTRTRSFSAQDPLFLRAACR